MQVQQRQHLGHLRRLARPRRQDRRGKPATLSGLSHFRPFAATEHSGREMIVGLALVTRFRRSSAHRVFGGVGVEAKVVSVVSSGELRIDTRFGKYEITTLVGRGGMGEVYEARDTELGRIVALKILLEQYSKDEAYRSRFAREAHAAALLQEPHVIPIHGFGEIDGNLYIDMRLVHGTDLRKMISRGPLEPSRAASITSQIAAALDAAHAEGLVHRDVKPENVIVTPDDFAYLLDFGIASRPGDTHLTQAGMTIGSFAYMAPERLTGAEATAAVDIYSLACLLYESLTGVTPFPTDSTERLISAHLTVPPPSASANNPRVPATLDDVIARGMAKDPDDRYGSAGAFARAAQQALRPRPPQPVGAYPTMPAQQVFSPTAVEAHPWPPPTKPPPAVQPTQPDGRGTRWVLPTVIAMSAALLLAGAGIVIGVLVGTNSGRDSPTEGPTSTRLPISTRPSPESPPTPSGPSSPPPLVRGVDSQGARCDSGIEYPGATGWGSRSGRGSKDTTCLFAHNVLYSYWSGGPPTRQPRTVVAPGAISCRETAGPCSGNDFVMQCAYDVGDWITCTGGTNAIVYLY